MFDKSKDYLLQTVRTDLLYEQKTSDAGAYGPAILIQNCVHQTQDRSSPDWTQVDFSNVYIWREMWLMAHTGLPVLSDRITVNGDIWLVRMVTYTDMDSSGFYQRYKLHCQRQK